MAEDDPGASVVAAARALRGVRWHHYGRDPRHGLDCVGLVVLAFRAAGIEVEDRDVYPRGHRGGELLDHIAAQGREVLLGADPVGSGTRDGDVLLFSDGLHVAHLGVRATLPDGAPSAVHAALRMRRVVEERLAGPLLATLRRAYRHPALERDA